MERGMPAENIESLRRAYDAFARRDIPSVLEVMSPDIEWDATDALAHTGVYHGYEGVAEYLRQLSGVWEDFGLEPEQFVESANGKSVLVLGVTQGRLKATGERIEARFAHIGHVRDGKVVKVKICLDRASAERHLEHVFGSP
jgi:ketosteroid isomerase-like protein